MSSSELAYVSVPRALQGVLRYHVACCAQIRRRAWLQPGILCVACDPYHCYPRGIHGLHILGMRPLA